MNGEQLFIRRVEQWAREQNCTFVIGDPDGHESDHLIDGMSAFDLWGWLLPKGVTEASDDYFGCVVWEEKDGHLLLHWETYE